MESTARVARTSTVTEMTIRDRIRGFITSNFYLPEGESLSDGESLLDRGLIDSTGVLEVVSFLEETFGIGIQDREMVPDNFDSIERIDAFVQRKSSP